MKPLCSFHQVPFICTLVHTTSHSSFSSWHADFLHLLWRDTSTYTKVPFSRKPSVFLLCSNACPPEWDFPWDLNGPHSVFHPDLQQGKGRPFTLSCLPLFPFIMLISLLDSCESKSLRVGQYTSLLLLLFTPLLVPHYPHESTQQKLFFTRQPWISHC